MNETELSLQRNGWVKQSDGSWSKPVKGTDFSWVNPPVASRLPDAFAKRPTPLPLEKSTSDEKGGQARTIVRITRFACRSIDFDNGAGGCKALVDAMRYENLIKDDAPEFIDFQFRQVRVKTRKEQGTLIEIEEIA